ncbi:hypothetical protein SLS62_000341 [Diatrype stigma]|uniref:NAD(P)-binding domain-containing protein n=1 Tax=Diatrype stigma TaxID=117547 RepID=A0AAN9V0R9_9PEZI
METSTVTATTTPSEPGAVFLTGGTGTVARRIAALLQAANIPCVAASRSGRSPPLPNNAASGSVAGVRFDWVDRSTWEPALAAGAGAGSGTIRAVFLVVPGMLEPGPTAAAFVDLSRTPRFGARRFVLLSSTAIEEGGPAMGQVHAVLRGLGDKGEIEWAVLRPSWFQENFATQESHLQSIREENKIYSATGPGRIPFVSAHDIAAVAAELLTTSASVSASASSPEDNSKPALLNREYLILGPELLSYADVAATLSRVLLARPGDGGNSNSNSNSDSRHHRAIEHVDLTEAELASRHQRISGMPEQYAAILAAMDTEIRNGAEERRGLGGDVRLVTGRLPRPFAEFAEENKDVWAT